MKKTLAAVLAAAMALSTATVAFAKDTLVDDDYYLTERDTSSVEKEIAYGKDIKRVIAGLGDFGQSELAELFDDRFQLLLLLQKVLLNLTLSLLLRFFAPRILRRRVPRSVSHG